jgi:hypothetical protein
MLIPARAAMPRQLPQSGDRRAVHQLRVLFKPLAAQFPVRLGEVGLDEVLDVTDLMPTIVPSGTLSAM